MSVIQLNPPIPIVSPKGAGYAHLLIDYGAEFSLLWVCFQDDTGECWTWPNHEIRGPKNTTMGRHTLSPFRNAPADAGILSKPNGAGGQGPAAKTGDAAPGH